MKSGAPFSLFRLLITLGVVAALFALGWHRLEIDTDVIDYLPRHDPAIRDALEIFKNHPIQDQLIVDVGLPTVDPDRLVSCGALVEKRLAASGLFKQVGLQDVQHLIPEMMTHIANRLPVLFSAAELEGKVGPLLTFEAVRQRLEDIRTGLMRSGRNRPARLIAKDPLGLRNIVMARLAPLVPSQSARFYQGQLFCLPTAATCWSWRVRPFRVPTPDTPAVWPD